MAFCGLASLLTGWVLLFVLPDVRAAAWSILTLGAALVVWAFLVDFRRVRGVLISRRGQFGIGAAVRLCLVIGIVLFANAVSVETSLRFDFTGLSQYTLTSQTKGVLANLNAPVEA